MPERFEICIVCKWRYINTLPFVFFNLYWLRYQSCIELYSVQVTVVLCAEWCKVSITLMLSVHICIPKIYWNELLDRITYIAEDAAIATDAVAWSVCVSVCPLVTFKNGWTDRDAIWGVDSWAQENVLDSGRGGTNPFSATRGDIAALRPFVKILWPLLFIFHLTHNVDAAYCDRCQTHVSSEFARWRQRGRSWCLRLLSSYGWEKWVVIDAGWFGLPACYTQLCSLYSVLFHW